MPQTHRAVDKESIFFNEICTTKRSDVSSCLCAGLLYSSFNNSHTLHFHCSTAFKKRFPKATFFTCTSCNVNILMHQVICNVSIVKNTLFFTSCIHLFRMYLPLK